MRIRHFACFVALVASGCATTHVPGWQGRDAAAFGTADSLCAAEAKERGAAERQFAYDACMARHGWTRG